MTELSLSFRRAPWRAATLTGLLAGALVGVCAGIVACGGDTTGPRGFAPDPLWSIQLNAHAVTLSTVVPHNTVQLGATVRTASGALRAELKPTYTVSDSTLTVTANGLVTALEQTGKSFVVATVRDSAANLTLHDTVYVAVTTLAAPPRLDTFSLHTPGDSARFPYSDGGSRQLTVRAVDNQGNVLDGLPVVSYISRDPSIASVDGQGVVLMHIPDRAVTIVSSVTFYGVTKTDSVQFAIGYPVRASVGIFLAPDAGTDSSRRVFAPDSIVIAVGGTVLFSPEVSTQTSAGHLDNVLFDDPTVADSSLTDFPTATGNIPVMQLPSFGNIENILKCVTGELRCGESRAFRRRGVFRYHSSISGAAGVIVVQ